MPGPSRSPFGGSVRTLADAVRFYATRKLAKDLEPLATKLTGAEIADVVAFLRTLDDAR